MKKVISIIIAFLLLFIVNSNKTKAQNLVPNPSFEDTLNCSGPWNCNCFLEIAYPWFNPNTATSDIFTTYPSCGYSTSAGMQFPKSGNSYAGFFAQFNESRDYLEIALFDSLLVDQWYCVSFYVSKSNFCSGAIDRIGAYLSQDSLLSTNPMHFAVTPQIESSQGVLLTDTTNWILISGHYKALGGEKFLTIGNFRDTSSTLFQNIDSTNSICYYAYYLIDDVAITVCDSLTLLSQINNYTNNIWITYSVDNLQFNINNKLGRQGHLKVFDVSGKLIKEYLLNSQTESIIISKSIFKSSFYLIQYIDSKNTYSKKIIIIN